MNMKRIIAIVCGALIGSLGLLWFLQGSGLVYIEPILCAANCEPMTDGSLTWAIVGAVAVVIGVVLAYMGVKGRRRL